MPNISKSLSKYLNSVFNSAKTENKPNASNDADAPAINTSSPSSVRSTKSKDDKLRKPTKPPFPWAVERLPSQAVSIDSGSQLPTPAKLSPEMAANKPAHMRIPSFSLSPAKEEPAQETPTTSPTRPRQSPRDSLGSPILAASHEMHRRTSSQSSHRSNRSINSPSTPKGFMEHRRSSSAPRHVVETHDAQTSENPDGTRRLNQYLLKDDIGKGSFGSVSLAIDVDSGAEFAVKEFSKIRLRKRLQSESLRKARQKGRPVPFTNEASHDKGAMSPSLDLIRTEVAIMKKIDHPNLVKLYEVLDVVEDDSLFMVLELCSGGPLMQIAMGEEHEPLDEETARGYFRQMVLGIEYLHHNGIIHRDIKPDNILKMADPEIVKICDFGVSEMFDKDNVQNIKSVGSPAFMSPELCITHHGPISAYAVDVWALGVTLYCMVCGHLPFQQRQLLDLYEEIKTEPVKLRKELSTELKDCLSRLLEKDPNSRITMDQLRDHPWVAPEDDPLPSKSENVTSLPEPTDEEIGNAFSTTLSSIVGAVKAANKFKKLVERRKNRRSISEEAVSNSSCYIPDESLEPLTESMATSSIGSQQSALSPHQSRDHSAESTKSSTHQAILSSALSTEPASMDDSEVEGMRQYEESTGNLLPRSSELSNCRKSDTSEN